MDMAFVNGNWSPTAAAMISIEDRGFQFGDGVYEVVRTYGRDVFGLPEHLLRLKRSAAEIQVELPYHDDQLEEIIQLGCKKSGYHDTTIYIQVTRGVAARGHAFPTKKLPTLVMTFSQTKEIPIKQRDEGVSVFSLPDLRWGKCHVKSLNLLPNVMAREQAKQQGDFEAIFIRHGEVMEGAGSNIFSVKNEKIITPPAGPFILSGITREVVLEIGNMHGLEMLEENLSLSDLASADELFLTGTTVEILPVVRLDGNPVASGKPGKVVKRLYKLFQNHVQKQ